MKGLSSLRGRALTLFIFHQCTMHLATAAGLNVALPAMMADFHVGIGTIIWIQIGYSLALAAGTIPLGQVAQVLGRRRLVLVSNTATIALELFIFFNPNVLLFIAARFLESLSRVLPWLILQVVALGGYEPEQRGKVLGFTRLAQGAALAVSPALTGFVTQQLGWRWMFMGSLLLFAAVDWGVLRWLPPDEPSPAGKRATDVSQYDVPGSLLLGGGMIAVLTAVQFGAGPQSAGSGVALGLAGLVLLAAFVAVEARSIRPMLPLALFRIRGVFVASGQVVFLGLANGALPVLFPLLFIQGYGWTAAVAGSLLFFLNVARVPSAPFAGWAADRFGPGRVALTSTALGAAGQLLAARLAFPPALELVVVALTLIGLGQGILSVANLKQIYTFTPAEHLHLAPGTNIVLLQLGSAAGQAFVAAAFEVGGARSGTAQAANPAIVAVGSTTLLAITAVFVAGMLLSQAVPTLTRRLAWTG